MCHIIGAGNTIPIASDLVIAISRSGASTQVLKALSLAKKKEMKILVITADPNSQIMDFQMLFYRLTTRMKCMIKMFVLILIY